jgi:hypothetical protein
MGGEWRGGRLRAQQHATDGDSGEQSGSEALVDPSMEDGPARGGIGAPVVDGQDVSINDNDVDSSCRGRAQQQPQVPSALPRSHRYRLYAVVNHFGSLGGGHYTAYARMPPGSRLAVGDLGGAPDPDTNAPTWHLYDDSSVQPVMQHPPEAAAVTPAAYVLFYRR